MAELVVESVAMVVMTVEGQRKACGGNSQQLNGHKLHQETEHEKGVEVVEEDDDYAKFVLGKKREEVATLDLAA